MLPRPEQEVLKRGRVTDGGGFLDESLARACIHCGLRLGSCPPCRETGNENDSPRGRIDLMRRLTEGRLLSHLGLGRVLPGWLREAAALLREGAAPAFAGWFHPAVGGRRRGLGGAGPALRGQSPGFE